MSAIVQYFEHSLALPFFGIGMKTDLFQSCGHCWVFQICWHFECSTLFFLIFIFTLFYFIILYWFCHTLTWIHHGCTCDPKHEPPSYLPPRNIPLGLTAASFRIWNSSTEIPSPSLAWFAVMLPKAHLTSHSRMSGSRWVIIQSWLSWCILVTSS